MTTIQLGALVRLNVPENERLHGAQARVVELTGYGAIVATSAAATGCFRASHSEMIPYAEVNGRQRAAVQAKDQGYTGDVCSSCGGVRMRRNGACSLCEDCGATSGCS